MARQVARRERKNKKVKRMRREAKGRNAKLKNKSVRQVEALQRRIDNALRERARDREEGGAEEEEFAEQDHPQQVCGSNQACPKKNLLPGDI